MHREGACLDAARDVVRNAGRIVFFTGAGMSAESGIATFRDSLTGLWERFDPALLASAGVVVVTVNYRLGLEGFGQLEGAPANRGLLDVVAALEWVRDSVAGFGGDPDRVTVFGESAGAGCVAALVAMPRARGLFRRAVAQSVPGTFFSPELASDLASACAAELGLAAPRADALADVDPELLVTAGGSVAASMADHRDRWGVVTHRPILVAPVVDGEVLPTTPWAALAAGSGRDVELLVGHTRDEHRLFSLVDGVLGQVTTEQTELALTMLAPAACGAAGFRQAFPGASDEQVYELVNGDWLFRMPSLRLAEAQVAGGGSAHLFELTWPAPAMGGLLGACHGLDVPLVFGNLDRGQTAMLIGDPPPPEAVQLSAAMRDAWVSFAVHGDPGWPSYDLDRRLTRLFDVPSSVATYPEDTSRRLWLGHTFAPLPLLGI